MKARPLRQLASSLGTLIAILLVAGFVASLIIIVPEQPEYVGVGIALKALAGAATLPVATGLLVSIHVMPSTRIASTTAHACMAGMFGTATAIVSLAMPFLHGDEFSFWIIRANGPAFELAVHVLAFSLLAHVSIMTAYHARTWLIQRGNGSKHRGGTGALRVQALAFLLLVVVGSTGFLHFLLVTEPRDFPGCVGASEPYHALPASPRYNTALDALDGFNKTALETLEIALWAFTRLRQPVGGFPIYCSDDFCTFVGDGGRLWPNEISLQDGTPVVGEVYLQMHRLEPNPAYLAIATTAGDAIVKAQDRTHGGFHKYARFSPDNVAIQPDTRNPRRHASFDDNTMQGTMIYLISLFNETGESRYLEALDRGFAFIEASQHPWGAWPQETGYPPWIYHSLSTLNDRLVEDMIAMYLLAIEVFPERVGEFRAIIDKAFDWLVDVQGNGGSGIQAGAWAQQYDYEHQPAWARRFEPPAMESSGTAGLVESFIDLYCAFNDTKYLEPVPAAIEWLNASRITWSDGYEGWSRLYELETNVPIYGLAEGGADRNPPYVYEFEAARGGYSWRGNWGNRAIDRWTFLVDHGYDITSYRNDLFSPPSLSTALSRATRAVEEINDDGYWLRDGDRIHCTEFSRHATNLMIYLSMIT